MFRPWSNKSAYKVLKDLNEPSSVAIDLLLLLRYKEIDETRQVISSRSSCFPVIRTVPPVRIH
jgi:hypothetical protein